MDDRWALVEKKRAAVAVQKRRLEWMIHGSTRTLQTLTQQEPTQVGELIAALELALSVAKELQQVNADAKELDTF